MLGGTSRPTNPDYEPDGIFQEGGAASPAATNPIPLPRASLSFLVKQPGGLGCKLHSKCSKCTQVGSCTHTQSRVLDHATQAQAPQRSTEHTKATVDQ